MGKPYASGFPLIRAEFLGILTVPKEGGGDCQTRLNFYIRFKSNLNISKSEAAWPLSLLTIKKVSETPKMGRTLFNYFRKGSLSGYKQVSCHAPTTRAKIKKLLLNDLAQN